MAIKLKHGPQDFIRMFTRRIRMTLRLWSKLFYSFVVEQFGGELLAVDENGQRV